MLDNLALFATSLDFGKRFIDNRIAVIGKPRRAYKVAWETR